MAKNTIQRGRADVVSPRLLRVPRFNRGSNLLYLLSTIYCLLSTVSYAGIDPDAGRTGLSFLKIGVGARAAAMGSAYTSVSKDQSSAYWNPAGLIGVKGRDVLLVHNEWIQDISHDYAGAAFGGEDRAFALSVIINSVGGLERRTGASLKPLGNFSVYDSAVLLSYAQRVHDNVSVGATVKWLAEKIHVESALGAALDLGAIYTYKNFAGGFSLKNVGGMNKLNEESVDLPVEVRFGASYLLSALEWGDILASTDVRVPNDSDVSFHAGIEWEYSRIFALRFGGQSGSDTMDISTGFGLRFTRWRLDYAFVPLNFGLGNSHRFAVGLTD